MISPLSSLNILCAIIVLIPLPWHIRACNVATVAISFWLFITNIIYAVDLIVWSNNTKDVAPAWCDLTTNILTGFNVAIPAACLCICIHLERIASFNQSTSRSSKHKRIFFQVMMCFALPLLYMSLHFIVQARRYDIFEDFGCRATSFISIPVVFLVWAPPLVLTTATVLFAGLAFRHFVAYRIQFSRSNAHSTTALTPSRYVRLITMSVVEIVWATIFTCVNIYYSLIFADGLHDYQSWDAVHDFETIDQVSQADTPVKQRAFLLFMWATVPVSSAFFFVFFAMGEEAVNEYRRYWKWCTGWVTKSRGRSNSMSAFEIVKPSSFLPSVSLPKWSSPSRKTAVDDPEKTLGTTSQATLTTPTLAHHPNKKAREDDAASMISDFSYPDTLPPQFRFTLNPPPEEREGRHSIPFDGAAVDGGADLVPSATIGRGNKRKTSNDAIYMTIVRETSS